jgi:hypothetical protein
MRFLQLLDPKLLQDIPAESTQSELSEKASSEIRPFKKLRGGFLMVLGYLLSPLCWWNDLVFNLPVAYGFGYLCSLISSSFLVPGAIAGYWLSNVVGILLMQAGLLDVVQKEAQERSVKKELLTGIVSSTVYTAVIVLLLQFKILETPLLSFHF